MNIHDAIERYLRYLVVECGSARATIEAYRRDLMRFVRYLESEAGEGRANLRPDEVEPDHVRAFLWLEGRRGLSARSLARALVPIKGLFRFLCADKLLAVDPTERVDPPQMGSQVARVLSKDAVTRLLEAPWPAGVLAIRDRALFETLYATGARASELVGLDVPALRLDMGVVRLLGKGRKERIVPIGRAATAAIETYVSEARGRLLSRGRADEPALFLSRNGRRLDRHALWRRVRLRAEQVGITPPPSPHTLRHSFATHLIGGGAGVRSVQELLGHANVATTERYTHVDGERLRAVHARYHPRA